MFLSFSLNGHCEDIPTSQNIRPQILSKNGFFKKIKGISINKKTLKKEIESRCINKKTDNKAKNKILKKEKDSIESDLAQNSYPRGWDPKEDDRLE